MKDDPVTEKASMNQMDKTKTLREVYRHPLLTEENLTVISDMHTKVVFYKGDFFLKRDERSNSYLILEDGLMRSFVYKVMSPK